MKNILFEVDVWIVEVVYLEWIEVDDLFGVVDVVSSEFLMVVLVDVM